VPEGAALAWIYLLLLWRNPGGWQEYRLHWPGRLLVGVSLLVGFGAVVLAPMIEEVLFRGLLYRWLRQRLPVGAAALLSALLHAGLHFDPAAIPRFTVTFVLFALLYEKTRSLWCPILAHGGHNLVAVASAFLLPEGEAA